MLGEGDVIRTPFVQPGELKCLKEVPLEPESLLGILMAYRILYILVEGLQVSVKRTELDGAGNSTKWPRRSTRGTENRLADILRDGNQ